MSRVLWLVALVGCTDKIDPIDDTDDTDTAQQAELIGILVTPSSVTVPLGEEVQLTATGLRADRSTVDLTAVVQWSSDAPDVATIGNGLDQEGVVTGTSVGSATLVAGTGSVLSPPVTVKVTQAELIGLNIEPASVSLQVGDTVQMRATAAFSDGTRSDASSQVRWITDDGAVATLSAGGLLTAAGTGQTEVVAEWNRERATPVTVDVVQSAMPDLGMDSVRFATSGNEVTATFEVINTGGVGASDYVVDVFIDPESPPALGDIAPNYFVVPYTDAGERTEVVWTFTAQPGQHELVFIVDTENAIAEDDEGNNVSSHPFSVTGETGGPNLEITYFDYIADSESIYYVIDVTNTGGEAVGEFYIDMWVDSADDPTPSGIGDRYLRIDGLGAGQTTSADFFFEDEYCVFCWSWAMADTNAEVEETDETDNVVGPLVVDSP